MGNSIAEDPNVPESVEITLNIMCNSSLNPRIHIRSFEDCVLSLMLPGSAMVRSRQLPRQGTRLATLRTWGTSGAGSLRILAQGTL